MERIIFIEIDDKELDDIFEELSDLKRKLRDCCNRLDHVPKIVVKKAPPEEAAPREED